MPWTSGTASGHDDLLEKFRLWIAGYGTAAAAVAGANTGNGTVGSISTHPASVTETITLTATSSTNFTVSGSVTGALAAATVGTPYTSAVIDFTITAGGVAFIAGDSFTIAVTEGAMQTAGYAWEEQTFATTVIAGCAWTRSGSTITLTLPAHTLATGEGVTISATSDGTALPNGAKTLLSTSTNSFTFTGGSSGGTSGTCTVTLQESHVYLKGLGNGGTDEIFVNLRSYKNAGTGYYNIELRGATGFSSGTGKTRINQAGISNGVDMCLISGSIPYWFIANGRRFIIVAKATTSYESCYAGFILPTGLPSEYPYPLAIGATHGTTRSVYTSTASNHRAFFNPGDTATPSLYLLDKTGAWWGFANYQTETAIVYSNTQNRVFPNGASLIYSGAATPIYPNLNAGVIDSGSSYTPFPCTLLSKNTTTGTKDIFGDFEGVFAVSGHNNASENIVQVSSVDHLVVQSGVRITKVDFAAIKLE